MFVEQINARNIKIKFDVNEKPLLLGDIVKITASGKSGILSQVLEIQSVEKNPNFNLADTKVLYTIDPSGKLIDWQGNLPSAEFSVRRLSAEEVLTCSNTLNPQNPLVIGELALYPKEEAHIETAFMEGITAVFCDRETQKDNILSVFACELSKKQEKTVILDFNNEFSDLKVSSLIKAGKDYKIPLDSSGLEILYSETLEGVSTETRAAIEDIFMEIENYLSSGQVEFIPFSAFRAAVDSVYSSNKMPELLMLRNKLLKISKNGIYADSPQEITALAAAVQNNNLVIADFSEISTLWQKHFIQRLIDSNAKDYRQNFFLLLDTNKFASDKAFMENISVKTRKAGINAVVSVGHEADYAVNLFNSAKNIIAFAPENSTKLTSLFPHFARLKGNEALILGKITNNIPLYVNLHDSEAFSQCKILDNSNIQSPSIPEIFIYSDPEDEYKPEITSENESEFNYSKQFGYNDISAFEEEANIPQRSSQRLSQELSYRDTEEDEQGIDHEEWEHATEELSFDEKGEGEYLSQDENSFYHEDLYDSDTLDTEVENQEGEEIYGDSSQEYSGYDEKSEPQKGSSFYDEFQDSDNSSTSDQDEKYPSGFTKADLANFMDDDVESASPTGEAGEDDFDYFSNSEFQDESILDYASGSEDGEPSYPSAYSDEEPVYVDSQPSIRMPAPQESDLPVYPVPERIQSTGLSADDFQEGDRVRHDKYGYGTVTKIIGSAEKRLCSIQFEEVGRRLLDPKLSMLEKLD